jgi:ribokinase
MPSNPIIVIGSANTDMVIKTDRLPAPGETRLGGRFYLNAGGKGANQAVAAARLGGKVSFVGKVGDDIFGVKTREGLLQEGIDTHFLFTDESNPSGTALIMVDDQGQNCIAVASGPLPFFNSPCTILVQLEIPLETVAWIANKADQQQKIILNPAPAQPLSHDLLKKLFLIVPNESEASLLTGITVTDKRSAEQAADFLLEKGVQNVIITLGAQGALFKNKEVCYRAEAPAVQAVDTTAAGDTFCGALAVALNENRNWSDALAFAVTAASLSVTRLGAQASVPYRHELPIT